MRSGKLAAASVLELLAGGARDLSGYERRVDEELMPELLAARGWASFYLWSPGLCYLLLRGSGYFWQTVCKVVRGDLGYLDAAGRLGPLSFAASLLHLVGSRQADIRDSGRRSGRLPHGTK